MADLCEIELGGEVQSRITNTRDECVKGSGSKCELDETGEQSSH